MILSRCCKTPVYVLADYYVCEKCDKHCATVSLIQRMEKGNDPRADGKVTPFFDQP